MNSLPIETTGGTARIFLNTHGTDEENITPELKELLEFMEHTNDIGRTFHSEQVNSLRKSVQTIQANEEMGVRYMQAWEERVLDRQEGEEEGKTKTLLKSIKSLMETTGWSAEETMDKMQVSERDREAVRPLL